MDEHRIVYYCSDEFYRGVEELIKRQLSFHANFSDLTIFVTGGY